MVGPEYVAIGFALLVLALFLAKSAEGMYFSPAFAFFAVFFIHAYVDPYYRYGVDLQFDFGNFATMKAMVISANLIMLVGYLLFILANARKGQYPARIDPTFGASSFYVAAIAVALSFAGLFFTTYQLGVFGEARGAMHLDRGAKQAAVFGYVLYALVPAIWLSLFTDKRGKDIRVRQFIVVCTLLAVLVYTIITFGRQFAFFIAMSCLLIYHARIQRIKIRQAVFFTFGLILVSAFALLRQLRVGVLELHFADILELFASGTLGLETISRSLFTAVPGQAVFSNVITMVDETQGYRFGATYFEALLALAVPDVLTGGSDTETPALWYARNYAPDVTGHGFDFSMFAEAYLNFGFWGIFVFFFVGMIVAHSSSVVRLSRNPVWIVWGSIMIANLMASLRNDSTPLFTRAAYFILPLLLLRYISKRLLRSRRPALPQAAS